jgi:hypothetical protein
MYKKSFPVVVILILTSLCFTCCSKKDDASNGPTSSPLPTVSTISVSYMGSNYSAYAQGRVSAEGSSAITAVGFCWGTSANPTLLNAFSIDGAGIGDFDTEINGLSSSTTYHVRAYATNHNGTAYGNDITYTTTNLSPDPVVVTDSVINYMSNNTKAYAFGRYTSPGIGAYVVTVGFCWSSTNSDPHYNDNHSNTFLGSGYDFDLVLSGLTPNTTYYIRAYAENNFHYWGYGNVITYHTLP